MTFQMRKDDLSVVRAKENLGPQPRPARRFYPALKAARKDPIEDACIMSRLSPAHSREYS
jgi:hypothetical protein